MSLFDALKEGPLESIQALVKEGAKVNDPDPDVFLFFLGIPV
jgi:hypothetical protein